MRLQILKKTTCKSFLTRVDIRHLQQSDLSALEWEGEFTHFRRLYADAYKRTQNGEIVMWVADLQETGIIGQVFIQLDCGRPELANGFDRAYLYSFRIRPAYRNLGLGTLMLKTIESDLKKRGIKFLSLNVAKDNPRAQKLYQRCGYRMVAHEPGVWSYLDHQNIWRHVNEPAWRMEKRL